MEASHFTFLEALGSDLTLAIVYRRCVKVCSLTECVFFDAADDDAKHLTLHLTSWIDAKRLPNMIATPRSSKFANSSHRLFAFSVVSWKQAHPPDINTSNQRDKVDALEVT
jgi:hypothetical protein